MKHIVLSTILASLLMTSGALAQEKAPKDATVKQVNKVAVNNAIGSAKDKQVKLAQEAISSLKSAHEGLLALEKNDKKLALDKLSNALGKLEVILEAKETPRLLPIDSIMTVNEFIGTSREIEVISKHVKELLSHDRLQEARELLAPLTSEIDITVVSLPLASYPDALKLAVKYIHDNKMDEAKKVLALALSTFTKVTEIVPIPLLKATDLIALSSKVAKEDKKLALVYLDAASESLKVAQKLGYVSKSATTYKILQNQIDDVKKEVKGPNKAEQLFTKLVDSLKEFKGKIFSAEKK